VLAGFEDPETALQIGTSRLDGPTIWHATAQAAELPGVRDFYLSVEAGQKLISFRIGNAPAYTVASLATPNRATLITLTLDGEGAPLVSQYLLPLGCLVRNLDPFVASRIAERNQLLDLKMLAESVRTFRNRRDLWKELPDYVIKDILYAKWIDPIASSLAAYELVRRGQTGMLQGVVNNLTRYFPDLPDATALATLGRLVPGPPYPSVPLFLDGLRAFRDIELHLPLPASNLDYTSPWTAWRGARE
jgi:hypothetical protein